MIIIIIILLNCLVQMKNRTLLFMIFLLLFVCFIYTNKKLLIIKKLITYNKIITENRWKIDRRERSKKKIWFFFFSKVREWGFSWENNDSFSYWIWLKGNRNENGNGVKCVWLYVKIKDNV